MANNKDNKKGGKSSDNNITSKEEINITKLKLSHSLLACNPSTCQSIREARDGHKYLILPLFDYNKGLHILNISEKELAECFINKFLK